MEQTRVYARDGRARYIGLLGMNLSEAVTYALPYGPPQPEDLVCFAEVTNASVHSILSHMDPFKSPGPDGILPSMLKQFASVLAPSLAVIFDRSLQTAIVPAEFKKANIVPIPKNNKGDPMALTNYRPVSLNAVLSKVFGKTCAFTGGGAV